MEELLDYAQASEAMNIKKGTLQWLVHKKRIPHIRLGKRFVRFRKTEIENWLRDREVTCQDLGLQEERKSKDKVSGELCDCSSM